jgi:hypothetical protein
MSKPESNRPETWDPVELVLYAEEYLDQYPVFVGAADEPASERDDYRSIAFSYLEISLACLHDAVAALESRVRTETTDPSQETRASQRK